MEEGFVIGDFLLPADQQPAEAVHPAMRPLHHPTPRPDTPGPSPAARLWPPDLLDRDVGRVTAAGHQLSHRGVVIPLVPQAVLRLLPAWARAARPGCCPGWLPTSFMSGRLAPATSRPSGTPRPSVQQRTLRALLGPIGGVLARLFLPERGLGHGPVQALPFPVDADLVVVLVQGLLPQRAEQSPPLPALEVAVQTAAGAELGRGGGPSSGRRYAGRRKCRPTPGVGARAAVPPCGSGAPGATGARCVPRGCPGCGKYRQPFHEKRP